MPRSSALLRATLLFLLLSACGRLGFAASPLAEDGGTTDSAVVRSDAGLEPDAGSAFDAGAGDAGDSRADAGVAAPDAGEPDAAVPDAGAPDAGGSMDDAGGPTCPPGSILSVTDHAYCIEELQSAPLPYFDAGAACSARGWGLCSGSEYDAACPLGLPYDVDSWEWIKDMVSASEAEKRVPSACGDSAIHPIVDPYPFRCCRNL